MKYFMSRIGWSLAFIIWFIGTLHWHFFPEHFNSDGSLSWVYFVAGIVALVIGMCMDSDLR